MKSDDVIAAKQVFNRDANTEMVIAVIPLIVGLWSFQWAVLLGLFWLTVIVIQFARAFRFQIANHLAFMDEKSSDTKDA